MILQYILRTSKLKAAIKPLSLQLESMVCRLANPYATFLLHGHCSVIPILEYFASFRISLINYLEAYENRIF